MQRDRWRSVGAILAIGAVLIPSSLHLDRPRLHAAVGGARLAVTGAQSSGASTGGSTGGTSGSAADERRQLGELRRLQQRRAADVARPKKVVTVQPPNVNETLLSPVPVPNPGVVAPLHAIGRVVIPRTGLDQPLFDGITQNTINAGPAHWPGTAVPGGVGNVVVAGHRTTYTRPFNGNGNIRDGDKIIFVMNDGWQFVYNVDAELVVPNTAMWIKDQHLGRRVTLFTCHPIGSARERLVVQGALVATLAPGSSNPLVH